MRLLIRETAEQDILAQVEWYAQQGLLLIARRFNASVMQAIEAVIAMPGAGSTRHSGNPRLAGLRYWPIKGFPEMNVNYLADGDQLTVVRVLHDKRDIGAILHTDIP